MPLNWSLGLRFFHPRIQLLFCSLHELPKIHIFLCHLEVLQRFNRPLVNARSPGSLAPGAQTRSGDLSSPHSHSHITSCLSQLSPLRSSESKLPISPLPPPCIFLPPCLLRPPWVCNALSPWLPDKLRCFLKTLVSSQRMHHTSSVLQ